MTHLVMRLTQYARRYRLWKPGETLVVGVSGGPDSLCLLHTLRQLAPEQRLTLQVAHLNHMLRGEEAEADALAVTQLAAEWGLGCTVGRADVAAIAAQPGVSLEEAARAARYAFLADTAARLEAQTIAVGHNADDQAETVLMHFLRGSGSAGLRGMLPRTRLTGTALHVVRPLLAITRAEVLEYCAAHNLQPRYDPSNEDVAFFRNRLRHELLPLLERYNPAIREVLAHTASVMAGDYELIDAQTQAAWEQTLAAPVLAEPTEVRFDRVAYRALPLGPQRALLRRAVLTLHESLRNVNWEHIERAVWVAREGTAGQAATLAGGWALSVGPRELRIAAEGTLWIEDAPQVGTPLTLAVPGETAVGDSRVSVRELSRAELPPDFGANADPWTAYLDADEVGSELTLRPPQPGERFQPLGMGGHTASLKEYMINAHVTRDMRRAWPVLEGRSGLAWVCGLRIDEHAAVGEGTRRVWVIVFHPPSFAFRQPTV